MISALVYIWFEILYTTRSRNLYFILMVHWKGNFSCTLARSSNGVEEYFDLFWFIHTIPCDTNFSEQDKALKSHYCLWGEKAVSKSYWSTSQCPAAEATVKTGVANFSFWNSWAKCWPCFSIFCLKRRQVAFSEHAAIELETLINIGESI